MSEVNQKTLQKNHKELIMLLSEINCLLGLEESSEMIQFKSANNDVIYSTYPPIPLSVAIQKVKNVVGMHKVMELLPALYRELQTKNEILIKKQRSLLTELADCPDKDGESFTALQERYNQLSSLAGRISSFMNKVKE